MAISKIEFPHGAFFFGASEANYVNIHERLDYIVANLGSLAGTGPEVMEPGISVVTPSKWANPTFDYLMEVKEAGDGTLHVLPRSDGSMLLDSTENPDLFVYGSRHTRLPEDALGIPLLSPHQQTGDFILWSYFFHTPR